MSAEFRLWSATLADPAEEAAFLVEHASAFRRNALLSIVSALFFYVTVAIIEPLAYARDAGLWPMDLTRYLLIATGAIALIRILRDRQPSVHQLWAPLFWTIMVVEFAAEILLDPLTVFDGFGSARALLLIIGYAAFSAITAVDFRWATALVGVTTATYVLAALSGHPAGDPATGDPAAGDPVVRTSFAMIMTVAGAGLLAIGHSLRLGARRSWLARTAAERANAVKTRFVATMSHEFRTPLNAILGMAELLAETRLEGRQRFYVELLGKAADHLGGLLGDILDFSRIEADRIMLEAVGFDPGEVVHEVVDLMTSEARRKSLSLDATLASNLPRWCRGDPLRLRQVLLNLVGNALRYTSRGGVTVRLEVAAGAAETLLFTVEDSGPGIPAEARALIFEPFAQADAAGSCRAGGLGLGLAIGRRLVELMGGRLWLEEREGRGSRFSFTAVLPALEREPAPEAAPKPLAESGASPALRILLADDSEMNRLVVAEHLGGLPVTIDQAADGAEALARFEAASYDAVLLDIQMPVLDGRATARAMRELEAERDRALVPIIALTAGALWEEREAALAAGCSGFLAKPVKRRTLFQVLAEQVPRLPVGSAPAGESPEGYAGRFLAEMPAALARLRAAAAREDRAGIAREAHALRGAALIAGLGAVAARFGGLEAAAAVDAPLAPPLSAAEAVLDGLADGLGARPSGDLPPAAIAAPEASAGALPIRVLLAEDHALVRDGVRSLLAAYPRLEVVAEAGDGISCVRETCRLEPELVIIDLMMPQMAGGDAIAEIKRQRPDIKILVLTAVTAPEPILAALRAGADGVVHKGAARTDLFAAITSIGAGTLYLSDGLPLAVKGRDRASVQSVALSLRERQTLKLLVEGRRNREIGDLLAISPKTVEKHRASLIKKLGVDSASGLAALALRYGLIEAASLEAAPPPDTDMRCGSSVQDFGK